MSRCWTVALATGRNKCCSPRIDFGSLRCCSAEIGSNLFGGAPIDLNKGVSIVAGALAEITV